MARQCFLHCRAIALTARAMTQSPDPHPPDPDRPDPGRPDSDRLRRLEAAVRALPEAEREIFLAVRLDGMDFAQIARRTGYSRGQVEKRLACAIARITRAMNEGGGL